MVSVKTVQKIAISDHLWTTVERMASEMGMEPDAVINQAIFTLARLNGFDVPGGRQGPQLSQVILPLGPPPSRAERSEPRIELPPPVKADSRFSARPTFIDAVAPGGVEDIQSADPLSSIPESREEPTHPPPPVRTRTPEMGSALPVMATEIDSSVARSLFLSHKGSHPVEVTGDRFVLGRGKHCNFVIDSTRVSREHAVVVREGNELFIEDLKSSNGTWYQNARISKRKIQDGDEFSLGSEPIKCAFRVTGRK